ncbi:MAG: Fur family transcriptional regulator [Polyangiales bacterium]
MSGALRALEAASLRKTPQRLAIMKAFVDDPTHPTAQVIFDRLRRAMPTMSFATVYNTLAALEKSGSCRVLQLGASGEDAARFDPNVTPHDHLVCERCGAVRDVKAIDDEPRLPTIARDGFRVHSVERIYRGTCADCRAKPRDR